MSGGDHGGDFGGGDFGGDFGYEGDDANNVGGMQIQADVHPPSLYFERDSERPEFDQYEPPFACTRQPVQKRNMLA